MLRAPRSAHTFLLDIQKFFHTPRAERRLLLQCSLWLLAASVLIRMISFPSMRRLLERTRNLLRLRPDVQKLPAATFAWAISRGADWIPGASNCLIQALVADLFLRTAGHQSTLHIGVRRRRRRTLLAHAWVAHHGEILIGAERAQNYVPLNPPGLSSHLALQKPTSQP